jgi:G3E family GTPase
MTMATPLIPATILTGFLGSGKSTLLRRVLTEAHGRKIAVIENEFGEENIDSEIIVSGGDEQVIQLSNGCLCCGIRDDLRATLADLAERRQAGEIAFDQVMIETTGLADPGPIAQTFFLDPGISARYRPDAILTLVDAKHAMDQFDARGEARRQVGFADRLFISKTDLVDDDTLSALRDRLRRMNPRAAQRVVAFGDVALDEVFDGPPATPTTITTTT